MVLSPPGALVSLLLLRQIDQAPIGVLIACIQTLAALSVRIDIDLAPLMFDLGELELGQLFDALQWYPAPSLPEGSGGPWGDWHNRSR